MSLDQMQRLARIKIIFFWVTVVGVALIFWLSVNEAQKNCDYDMEILTVHCQLERHKEELRQMELRD